MTPLAQVCLGLGTTLVAYGGVGVVRRWATALGVLDLPGGRSSHERPTPRGGGLAIAVIGLVVFVIVGVGNQPRAGALLWLALGAAIVAGVSLADDLRSLPVSIRLAAHFLGAFVVVNGIGALSGVGLPSGRFLDLGWLAVPVSFLWVMGLTNAYNFMDGIDGIAGAQAVVAGMGWLLLAGSSSVITVIGLVLSASSLGFLLHNWPPAKIFLGDVGSAFIGYVLAVTTIIAARSDRRLAFVGFLLVWPFVFDTVFTFLRRLRRGENVLAAHRSHLYQRLVVAGFSHRLVTLLYAALATTGLGLTSIWLSGGRASVLAVLGGLVASSAGLWALVEWAERTPRLVRDLARPSSNIPAKGDKLQ